MAKRAGGWLRSRFGVPGLVFAVVLVGMGYAYGTNVDMDGDPAAVRGDGRYHPVLARGDGHMTFLMLRSFALDGDLDFDNDLRRFGDPWRQPRTKTGRRDISHPIGPVLVWTPVLLTAHGLSKLANLGGADIPSHGYTLFHQRVLYFSSVLFAFFAAVLGYRLARRLIPGRALALAAAVAVLLGTSVTYYAIYMPSYVHAMDAFASALFLYVWATGVTVLAWRRFVVLGLLLGLSALIRPQAFPNGAVVAVELLVLAWVSAERPRRAVLLGLAARGAATLLVALAVFSVQLVAWKILFGEWLHAPNGPRYVRYAHPEILKTLFSSRNGWLSTTPIAYAAVLGLPLLFRAARRGPSEAIPRLVVPAGLLLVVAIQVYLNSCIYDWWAQASYGNRRLCSVTLPLVVGLTALLFSVCAARRALPRVLLQTAVILGLGWFVVWNVNAVEALAGGKAAGVQTGTLPSRGVPAAMLRVAKPIWKRWGNPFAFPANAYFALRYGVPWKRWDEIAGNYVSVPSLGKYATGAYRKDSEIWPLDRAAGERYLLDGWSPPQRGARPHRLVVGARARALVPIHTPEALRLRLPLAAARTGATARAAIRWNGHEVAAAEVGEWREVELLVPGRIVSVGENTLEIAAAPGSVAVGALSVGFP